MRITWLANIFIGNYLYLKAEQEKKQLDTDFKKLNAPTRMQYARYKDGLSRVLSNGYSKAKEYLQECYSAISIDRGTEDIE